jgi:hypothetical protein
VNYCGRQLVLFALFAGISQPALAQDAGPLPPPPEPTPVLPLREDGTVSAAGERLVYTPADFARFAPRSALDMLQQVPGFRIQSEGAERGLGQASGNVLINGQRIASKSGGATDELGRIPAANVVQIEIVDGATLNVPGLTGRVANVVTRLPSTGDVKGQFEWAPQLATEYGAANWLEGRASVSGAAGPVRYTLGLQNQPFRRGSGGPNIITDASNAVIADLFTISTIRRDGLRVSGNFKVDGPGATAGNLNLSYSRNLFRFSEIESGLHGGALNRLEQSDNSNKGYQYELGGDFQFSAGPGNLKLIGLERFQRSDRNSQSTFELEGTRTVGRRFLSGSDSGERIGRAEYSWQMAGADLQVSGEAAFNRLQNVAGLFVLNTAGEFVEVPFPRGTGGVTEDRYEAIVSYSRPLTSNLSMQLTAGGESSTLAQTGANAVSRSFLRPKGSLSLAWAPASALDVSLRIARRVGQLNFGDFLASVNLSNDNQNAGNEELVPQQSWETQLEARREFGAWGSATLTVFHNRIQDYVTIIPLQGGLESQGNIDSARRSGINLVSTLRLDPIGFRGAKFDINTQFERSRLLDPVTAESRAFDNSRPRNLQVDFRHDVPATSWAWGGTVRNSSFAPYYRVAEFGIDRPETATFGSVFIENKDVLGMTVRARVSNIFDNTSNASRTVFAGPRDRAAILFTENQQRKSGRVLSFSVRGSF